MLTTMRVASPRRGVALAAAALVAVIVATLLPARADEVRAACVDGFELVESIDSLQAMDVQAASASKAIIAGTGRLAHGRWGARIVRFDRAGWKTLTTKSPGQLAAFIALDGSQRDGYWAVGDRRTHGDLGPLAVQQTRNGAWRGRPVPNAGSKTAALTDVAVRRRDAAWAVGYRLDGPGSHRPLVLRWDGKRWSSQGLRLGSGRTGLLTAVSSTPSGGTWVAGSVTSGKVERPYIARRVAGRWRQVALPKVGPGSISAIMVHGKRAGWAVGYRLTGAGIRPLALRWDGRQWSQREPVSVGGEALYLDVARDGDSIVLAGSEWQDGTGRMRGFVSRRRVGGDWSVQRLAGFNGDAIVAGIGGITPGYGFAVALAATSSALAVLCDPGAGPRSAAVRRGERQARRVELRAASGTGIARHTREAEPAPRAGLAAVPPLQVRPRPAAEVRIVDATEAAGLPTAGHTYGAVVRDFDGNGWEDVFIGGHGDTAVLHLNDEGRFTRTGVDFPRVDRHGCAAADFDRSGLPDLYCTLGGAGGTGIAANELWLDPGGPSPRLAADAGGVRALLGRGRIATVFDFDDDGQRDLALGQAPGRKDGLPSVNRIYRWVAPGKLSPVAASGIEPAIGAIAFDSGDFDRDGRVDLLMVAHDATAAEPRSSVRLYRNTAKGLKDVTQARGIKSIGERDAELMGLDGDDRLDLVQLSRNRLRVSLQRGGSFTKVFERKLTRARNVAVGDADGDGDMDLFVLRHKTRPDDRDLVLFNDGSGRRFTAVKAPSRTGGDADEVVAIDHDGNGMTDFLVLNGLSPEPGPIQLIAFYP